VCLRRIEWKQFTLREPDEVKSATGAYRSDMDILGDFLAECTKVEPGSQTTSADLSLAYNKWRQQNGENSTSERSLGMRLKERMTSVSNYLGSGRLLDFIMV
jgi:putative DNA primase/helicase